MAFNLRKPPSLTARHDAYPYQLDAVRAVESLPYAAIFHEQGLGKTKIAVDLILLWLRQDVVDTVFIVTKKTLVQNWINELAVHSHIRPRILSDNKKDNRDALNSAVLVYIMNYEAVLADYELIREFLAICKVAAILDESQKIKNPKSKLAECFHQIAEGFARRVIMTGTPAANRPYDMWSQIKFLDGGESLGESFSAFKKDLDLPSNSANPEKYSIRLTEVIAKIKFFSVRETKDSAGLALPGKTIRTHVVKLAPKQAKIYTAYKDEMRYEYQHDLGYVVDDVEYILKKLLRLVQCASNPMLVDKTYDEICGKQARLLELLDEIDIGANKAIIWTGFIENANWLVSQLREHDPQKIHGKMSIAERNRSIEKFKKHDNCRVLVATPGAAKEGLTLTVANHAVFYDRGFSLDDYLQAQDRIHRISQTQECFVHNLIAQNTIDEWVDILLNAKHQAAKLIQGDISQESFDKNFNCDLSEALTEILSPANNII